MLKKYERNLLSHLKAETEYADTYFCSIAKNNKNRYMDTVAEQVKAWVEKHGGYFKIISDKKFIGDRKGYLVKIIFPTYSHAKQIMASF